jgi:hypothetical protein
MEIIINGISFKENAKPEEVVEEKRSFPPATALSQE